MRKNLLKNMILALLLTAAVPTLTAQVHVGDILCEGNAIISPANYSSSGATAIGVVFYVDNTGQHGWAVALRSLGNYPWFNGSSNTSLPNYTNTRQAIYDLDGYENTRIIRGSYFQAAYAVDFDNGWYLPAIGQLNYLYGNLVEVNASLTVVGGTRVNGIYWSSTEATSDHAWFCTSTGRISYNANDSGNSRTKSSSLGVRAVRNF